MFEIQKNLLIVENDQEARENLLDYFQSRFDCDEAESIEAALHLVSERDYAVILCNQNLPLLGAAGIVPYLQTETPNSVIVLIGDEASGGEIIEVFRSGVFDYVQQPYELPEVDQVISRAYEQFELKRLKSDYQIHLENLSAHRATELDKALDAVESAYRITLKALVQALETRDFETRGHSERVVTFALRLGHEVGLNKDALKNLELGALLHDIGKIGVPDSILRKPAALNEEEWEKMKLHPLHGQKILRNIKFLEGASRVIGQHHEKWDGTGYPHGVRGEEIDLGARIFSVVDAFDAMTGEKIYRQGCSYEAALVELERCAGTQFDPNIVEAFKRVPREDWEILRERSLLENQEVFSFQTVVAELVFSRQQFETVH